VIRRYGGGPGRRLAGPGPVPWEAVAADPQLRELVHATLRDGDRRVDAILDPAATDRLVDGALASGALYPLGLVLTLELTLRRIRDT
jgi:hypothetical protein